MIMIMLFVLFSSAFLTLLSKRYIVAIAGIAFAFASMVFMTLTPGVQVFYFSGWVAPFGITWAMDKMSLLMGVLVTGVALACAVFSARYVGHDKNKYYTLLCLLTIGLMGISLTGDIFNLYVFMEITSIASYALIAFPMKKMSVEGSIKYLIIGSLSSSVILIGIIMLYGLTGTLNMADLATKVSAAPEFLAILGVIIAGLATKAALVPLHFWLPDAYSVAPSPISAMLFSVIKGASIYMTMRVVFTIFGLGGVMWVFIMFGVITMIVGGFMALLQNDIKRLLGYSSISQTGYIFVAIGTGTLLGISGGIFHMINNVLLKSMLFLCFGIVIWHTGTRKMDKLGGLGKQLPWVAFCFAVGALSMAGLPPFSGFASKWVIYIATWEISPLLTAVSVIMSAITLAYFLKAFSCIFLGQGEKKVVKKTPLLMLAPVLILTAIILVIGIFPEAFFSISQQAAGDLLNRTQYIKAVLGVV
jgi:multicomponent Na+:H+ antiporter subunit D